MKKEVEVCDVCIKKGKEFIARENCSRCGAFLCTNCQNLHFTRATIGSDYVQEYKIYFCDGCVNMIKTYIAIANNKPEEKKVIRELYGLFVEAMTKRAEAVVSMEKL